MQGEPVSRSEGSAAPFPIAQHGSPQPRGGRAAPLAPRGAAKQGSSFLLTSSTRALRLLPSTWVKFHLVELQEVPYSSGSLSMVGLLEMVCWVFCLFTNGRLFLCKIHFKVSHKDSALLANDGGLTLSYSGTFSQAGYGPGDSIALSSFTPGFLHKLQRGKKEAASGHSFRSKVGVPLQSPWEGTG